MKPIKTGPGITFTQAGFVDKQQYLFSVTPGVDQADALSSVSDMLDAIADPITEAGMGDALEGNGAWLVLHTLSAAKAVIDSLIVSAEEQEFSQALTSSCPPRNNRPIFSRDELSFTSRDSAGRMVNWPQNNPGIASDMEKGAAFFDSEIASLASQSERDAFNAIRSAITDMGGRYTCLELGFAEAVARAAVLGLRARNNGLPEADYDSAD